MHIVQSFRLSCHACFFNIHAVSGNLLLPLPERYQVNAGAWIIHKNYAVSVTQELQPTGDSGLVSKTGIIQRESTSRALPVVEYSCPQQGRNPFGVDDWLCWLLDPRVAPLVRCNPRLWAAI